MDKLDSTVLEYIKNCAASYHIEFYIKQGFDIDCAIRRGWEEAYEELLETVQHRANVIAENLRER